MTQEMQALIKQAESGDRDAMFKLGSSYLRLGDFANAEKTWLSAYERGHRSAGACLAMIIYGNNDSPLMSLHKFLQQLNDMQVNGNGWALMHIGLIRCGGEHQWSGTFRPEQFEAIKDPASGFQAIEYGVSLAEEADAQPKLDFRDYFHVAEVYRKYDNWQKSVDFLVKSLNAMTEEEKIADGQVVIDLLASRKNILHGKVNGTVALGRDEEIQFLSKLKERGIDAYKDKLFLKSLVSDIYVGDTTKIKIMNVAINEGLAVDLADLLCLDESRQKMEFNKIVSRFASSYGMDKDLAKEAVRSLGLGVGLKLGIM